MTSFQIGGKVNEKAASEGSFWVGKWNSIWNNLACDTDVKKCVINGLTAYNYRNLKTHLIIMSVGEKLFWKIILLKKTHTWKLESLKLASKWLGKCFIWTAKLDEK